MDNKEELRSLGGKLSLLIKSSTLEEDVKEELFQILPQMSLDQLEKLTDIFEAKFLDEKTKEIDEEYKRKIEEVYKNYNSKQEEIDKKFLEEINKAFSL